MNRPLIKQRQERANRHAIFRNNGYKGLDQVTELVSEAKRDFPQLADKDIELVTYSEQHRGTLAIEFRLPEGVTAPDYVLVSNLERCH